MLNSIGIVLLLWQEQTTILLLDLLRFHSAIYTRLGGALIMLTLLSVKDAQRVGESSAFS